MSWVLRKPACLLISLRMHLSIKRELWWPNLQINSSTILVYFGELLFQLLRRSELATKGQLLKGYTLVFHFLFLLLNLILRFRPSLLAPITSTTLSSCGIPKDSCGIGSVKFHLGLIAALRSSLITVRNYQTLFRSHRRQQAPLKMGSLL